MLAAPQRQGARGIFREYDGDITLSACAGRRLESPGEREAVLAEPNQGDASARPRNVRLPNARRRTSTEGSQSVAI